MQDTIMVSIFTETTTILATEFVEKFAADKLALALFKVGQETGIQFNRRHHTFIIAGHWNEIKKAHTTLEHILEDEIICRERPSMDLFDASDIQSDDFDKEKIKEKIPFLIVNNDGKPGRKPGNSVRQSSENSGVPDPVVMYQYQERAFMNQAMMKPSTLLHAIDGNVIDISVQGQNNQATRISTENSKKDEWLQEKLSDVKDQDDGQMNVSETKITCAIKNEIPDVYMEMSDNDTDIDEQYLTEETINHEIVTDSADKDKKGDLKIKFKLERTEKASAAEPENRSRRKSKPVKYVATSDDTEEAKEEIVKKEPKRRKGRPQKPATLKNETSKTEQIVKIKEKIVKIKAEKPKRKRIGKQNKEDENAEYHCELCSYTGNKKANLKEHIKRKHRNKYTCDVCQKQFGFNKDLNRHKRQVHAEPTNFCDVCNKFYKSKRVYDEHIQTHEVNYVKPNYDCKMCEKTFSTKYVLAAHIKAEHLGMKKSYMCPTCGRSFTQKNSYVMHANVHAGIKPYVCDICGKAFTYDKSLKEHKFMHDNIRRFQCHICSKTFRQTTSLRIHMKVHKETKDYMCTACGKGFTQKQALLRHERIHSGDKPYMCSLCCRTFSDYSIIRRHMMLIHKKDPKDWRSDIVSNLKRKKDYYIDGGPGHHVRELKSADDVKIKTSTEPYNELDISSQVDNIVKHLDDDARIMSRDNDSENYRLTPVQRAPDTETDQISNEEGSSSQNIIQDLSQSHMHLSQPVFPAHNLFSSHNQEHQQHQQLQASNSETKMSDPEHHNSSSPMPINYSVIDYSASVTVPNSTTPNSVSDASLAARYQSLVESYRAQGQHRDIYGAGAPSAISTMAGLSEQLRGQIALPPVSLSGESVQPQHLPNPWGYPGYSPYYNPSNFPQYQGPQN